MPSRPAPGGSATPPQNAGPGQEAAGQPRPTGSARPAVRQHRSPGNLATGPYGDGGTAGSRAGPYPVGGPGGSPAARARAAPDPARPGLGAPLHAAGLGLAAHPPAGAARSA